MKFLITSILFYFAYKMFIKPLLRLKDKNQDNIKQNENVNEDDYIDYEEVD